MRDKLMAGSKEFREQHTAVYRKFTRSDGRVRMRRTYVSKRIHQGKCPVCGRFLLADGSCPAACPMP